MRITKNRPAVRTLGALLEAKFPVREYLISPWLRQGESAMVWAATGVGKTMLTLTMALMIAGGGSALGWASQKPRRVIVIDGEMAREDLQDRAALLMDAIDGIDREAASANLAFMARTWQTGDVEFPDLNDGTQQDVLFAEAQRHNAEVVFLDNFSTLANVADENDAAAMGPTLGFLMRLKAARRACVLVHHSGKSGETYRGSSRLAATFEIILGLKRVGDGTAEDGAAFSVTWEKFRGKRNEVTRTRDVRLTSGSDGAAEWRVEVAANEKLRQVVEAVRSCRYSTQKAIAAALVITEVEVGRRKMAAIDAGLITKALWNDCLAEAKQDGDETADF